MPSEPESAAAAFTRAGQDAVTHARRVAGTALARNVRHREDNRELMKAYARHRLAGGGAVEPTPRVLRGAAARFRAACGLPMPHLPTEAELVRSAPEVPSPAARTSDEEEDFSQLRIMSREP
ncbi:hypothetical protein ACQPXB_04175 [Amycolatopsis sp. CA-161197]|uniref:hypothetical protein n=1 Tax=unclassified Amycolatopsis TaxID=2618356 RepID=UPI00345387C0